MRINSIYNFIKHLVCLVLLLQMIAIAIDLPGLQNLRDNYLSLGASDKELPAGEEKVLEKASDNIELYFFPIVSNKIIAFELLLKQYSFNRNYTTRYLPRPIAPPPKSVQFFS